MRAKLKFDIPAEGGVVPAGTYCKIENSYPAKEGEIASYDLESDGVLFWVKENEIQIMTD